MPMHSYRKYCREPTIQKSNHRVREEERNKSDQEIESCREIKREIKRDQEIKREIKREIKGERDQEIKRSREEGIRGTK